VATGGALEVLRGRTFRLLFAARTISFFGTNLAPIAVAFAVLGLGGSATDVGLAFAAWTLAQVSTLLAGGVLADRLPRRLVMIASDVANVCVRSAMGGLLVTGHARIWELIVLQAIGGAAVALYSPASTGLVPEVVPAGLLHQANAFMSIARYAAFPVGAAVGGTLVATVGAGYALLLDGATYATSALLLSMMRLPGGAATGAATNFVRELREGWQAFTEHTWVWLLTLWISLYFLVTYAPFFVLGPYIAKQSLGGASAWTVVVIGAAALLAGFAFSFGTVMWDTSLQKQIPRDKLSRVSAYNWMGAMAVLPAGYAIAGPVADMIGISTSLWIGAAWIVVTTAAVLCVPDVRNFRIGSLSTAPPRPVS
jgi:MFS family permease